MRSIASPAVGRGMDQHQQKALLLVLLEGTITAGECLAETASGSGVSCLALKRDQPAPQGMYNPVDILHT
jgi:phosphoserine phosphatase